MLRVYISPIVSFPFQTGLIKLSLRKLWNFGIFESLLALTLILEGRAYITKLTMYTNCMLIVHGLDKKPTRLLDLRDSADLSSLFF